MTQESVTQKVVAHDAAGKAAELPGDDAVKTYREALAAAAANGWKRIELVTTRVEVVATDLA